MKWRIAVICAVLLLALCSLPAGAAELPGEGEKYIVVPLDEYSDTQRAAPITGTIRQGETQAYTYQVVPGKTKLTLHLEWTSGTGNDLTLKVHTPENQNMGPYNDDFDGQDDNKIGVGIIKNPLSSGEWKFEISGYQVSGTESFSLTINAI